MGSYASIASHETPQSVLDTELPAPPEVVVLKDASSKPLVINVEEKPVTEEEEVRDTEGFVEVSTKKIKKERRRSRKISQDEKEEETLKKEASVEKQEVNVNETKPSGIALPITEMTDDWMDDDVAIGPIESEEEEVTDNSKVLTEKRKEEEVVDKPETNKPEEKKAPGIALPITEMTDDWMDDDVAIGSIESEEEEVTDNSK